MRSLQTGCQGERKGEPGSLLHFVALAHLAAFLNSQVGEEEEEAAAMMVECVHKCTKGGSLEEVVALYPFRFALSFLALAAIAHWLGCASFLL